MPYIPQARRLALTLRETPIKTTGELNFVFSDLIDSYMATYGLGYTAINDVLGALEGAKAEFLRRIVAPYEDRKRLENGDVYHKGLYR
jgi:hypothetical protein